VEKRGWGGLCLRVTVDHLFDQHSLEVVLLGASRLEAEALRALLPRLRADRVEAPENHALPPSPPATTPPPPTLDSTPAPSLTREDYCGPDTWRDEEGQRLRRPKRPRPGLVRKPVPAASFYKRPAGWSVAWRAALGRRCAGLGS
jgi:hypothetical protein